MSWPLMAIILMRAMAARADDEATEGALTVGRTSIDRRRLGQSGGSHRKLRVGGGGASGALSCNTQLAIHVCPTVVTFILSHWLLDRSRIVLIISYICIRRNCS
jgi:hypothetical protein